MSNSEKPPIERFSEIIRRKEMPLRTDDYAALFTHHPLIRNVVSIGPCFHAIGDMTSLKFIEVSDKCKEVLGYDAEEVIDGEANFMFHITHPDDQDECLQVIKASWEFLRGLPREMKMSYISNFYHRVIKKDGSTIHAQQQAITLDTDLDGEILVVCMILTDISHLNFSDEVKVTLVNPLDNSCITFKAQEQKLLAKKSLLSKRESEILKLIVAGASSKEIADRLFISYHTARTHRKNILEKLHVKNTAELINYALANGLTTPTSVEKRIG